MVRATNNGVNTTQKRLADGTIKTYDYHRDTGAPLPGKPGDAAFMAAFTEAETVQPKDVGNVNAPIPGYLLSLTFDGKRASTLRGHKRMLMGLGERFGKLPIRVL